MPEIDRDQVQTMMESDADVRVVDVLEEKEYQKFHLPGAINVPLGDDFDERIQAALPAKHEPVIVYCASEQCDASPKAARRMEALGYDRVYDYAADKTD